MIKFILELFGTSKLKPSEDLNAMHALTDSRCTGLSVYLENLQSIDYFNHSEKMSGSYQVQWHTSN